MCSENILHQGLALCRANYSIVNILNSESSLDKKLENLHEIFSTSITDDEVLTNLFYKRISSGYLLQFSPQIVEALDSLILDRSFKYGTIRPTSVSGLSANNDLALSCLLRTTPGPWIRNFITQSHPSAIERYYGEEVLRNRMGLERLSSFHETQQGLTTLNLDSSDVRQYYLDRFNEDIATTNLTFEKILVPGDDKKTLLNILNCLHSYLSCAAKEGIDVSIISYQTFYLFLIKLSFLAESSTLRDMSDQILSTYSRVQTATEIARNQPIITYTIETIWNLVMSNSRQEVFNNLRESEISILTGDHEIIEAQIDETEEFDSKISQPLKPGINGWASQHNFILFMDTLKFLFESEQSF